ncbi:MAG: hypothetical protein KJP00_03980 [Bacteroidia bacterium]|nr:hypothetical protein [Bacteroidia bacterium]
MDFIVISPAHVFTQESEMVNRLFDLGLSRYHLDKAQTSEQVLAEILEKIEPRYLPRISLHSHFHLVLAYGVGGIHYSFELKKGLDKELHDKVKLYQEFGIRVSMDISKCNEDFSPGNYAILKGEDMPCSHADIFPLDPPLQSNVSYLKIALQQSLWDYDDPIERYEEIQLLFDIL